MILPSPPARWCRIADNSWDRFVSPMVAAKYNLDRIPYQGIDQVVEVDRNGRKL